MSAFAPSIRTKRWILAGAIVAVVTVLLLVFLSAPPPSAIQLVFLGYTNVGTQPEAVFSVRFPPNFGGCGWKDPEVSRKEGTVWKGWSNTNASRPKMRYFTEPPKPSPNGKEPRAVAFAAFTVETTNAISRIVIEVNENPRRESFLAATARVLWGWMRANSSRPSGRNYFLTNETSIKPAL